MALVAVTGANGFAGRVLVQSLVASGFEVRGLVRTVDERCDELPGEFVATGDMVGLKDWSPYLRGASAVVHLAARVHRMDGGNDEAAYMRENAEVPERLMRGALACGCGISFISSIKVNGEATDLQPFTAKSEPHPQDAYGRSKWAAESCLAALCTDALRLTILRPPLVYGRGVGANFGRLLNLVERGMPLPLGAVRNRRSLISGLNLADAILASLVRDGPKVRTYLVSDNEAASTPELLRTIAAAMQRKARIVSVPLPMLRALAQLAGRQAEFARLTSSLVIDQSETREHLGWTPALSLEEGLRRTVGYPREEPNA